MRRCVSRHGPHLAQDEVEGRAVPGLGLGLAAGLPARGIRRRGGAAFVPRSMAGVGGRVAEGGRSAALGAGTDGRRGGRRRRGTGAVAAGFGPPWDRRAAALVMRRDPHPGHVTMPSGSLSGPTGVLQRGQFMSRGPGGDETKARDASIT